MMVEMLLCKPDHYAVQYEINPWMSLLDPVDPERARQQWDNLCNVLVSLGVKIDLLPPIPGLPDMVFTGDGGAALDGRFLVSSFRPKERRPESQAFSDWATARGLAVEVPPPGVYFEGLGDLVINEIDVIAAYGQRASPEVGKWFARLFPEMRVISLLELVNPRFFHLGMSLSLLDGETGLYVPDAFSAESLRAIEALPYEMLPVGPEDAAAFAVNVIVVDRHLIVHDCTTHLSRELERRHFHVHRCDVSEFVKSGGGVRCLVLPVFP